MDVQKFQNSRHISVMLSTVKNWLILISNECIATVSLFRNFWYYQKCQKNSKILEISENSGQNLLFSSKRRPYKLNYDQIYGRTLLIWTLLIFEISVYYTVSFSNNKNSGYFRHFRQIAKFLIIPLVL